MNLNQAIVLVTEEEVRRIARDGKRAAGHPLFRKTPLTKIALCLNPRAFLRFILLFRTRIKSFSPRLQKSPSIQVPEPFLALFAYFAPGGPPNC
jgi:hypothetical protein